VKRLRTLKFRSYVLPVILAALACRALAPSGFMTSTTQGTDGIRVVQTRLCSVDKNRSGTLSVPGDSHDTPRCDHCLSPMGHAPIALLSPLPPARLAALVPQVLDDQVAHATSSRTQLARAPPHG
jgi:hypothetical protein